MRTITRVLAAVALVTGVFGVVFVVGMRTKSPPVLRAVRRTSRTMKPLALRSAGTRGSGTSIVRHVGRTTGRAFETPVAVVATDDAFVVALPYGMSSDWLRNVLAAGSATIVTDGAAHEVHRPEVVPMAAVASTFSPADQRVHRLFNVEQCLQVRRADAP
jgi:deazaflavin-dependent oxidoreductase (nitroreductase family)